MSSRPNAPNRRSTKSEYIETDTGNKISRKAHIEGKQHIMLGGKSVLMADVTLRGDLHRLQDPSDDSDRSKGAVTAINIGRACVISTNCTLRPPMRVHHGVMTFYPMRMGDNVFIGTGTHISSIHICSHAHIGANCVLGAFSVIKDNAKVLPNTVVPPHMIVPAGSIVAGKPARIVGEVGDGWGQGGGVEGEEFVEGGDLRPLVRSIKG